MDIIEYIEENNITLEQLASNVGTRRTWLYQVAKGYARPSKILARAIERETEGAVTVADLRPVS